MRVGREEELASRLNIDAPGSVKIIGSSDATIYIRHAGQGIVIQPKAIPAGHVDPVPIGARQVILREGTWASHQFKGQWICIHDTAINPRSQAPTSHWRRVLDNIGNEVLLEEPVGRPIPATATASFLEPIDEVVIRDLTVTRSTPGGANIVIKAARSVTLRNLRVEKSGDMSARRGNGITVQHADRVNIEDVEVVDSGAFGLFIYNSDNIDVKNFRAERWASQFGLQLKDCRNGRVTNSTAVSDGEVGEDGFNLKCSGLNPARDLRLTRCVAEGTTMTGFQFASITAEGSGFIGTQFVAEGCRASRTKNGFVVIQDDRPSGKDFEPWLWKDCEADNCTGIGFGPDSPGMRLEGFQARQCGRQAVRVTERGQDVQIVNGTITHCCNSRKLSKKNGVAEILVQGRVRIENIQFERSEFGYAVHGVRDIGGEAIVSKCRVLGDSSDYSKGLVHKGRSSA